MIKQINNNKASNSSNSISTSNKSLTISMLLMFCLTSCSGYKSSWDCPNAKGIGCSSLEYADQVARQQILLNQTKVEQLLVKNKNTSKPRLMIRRDNTEIDDNEDCEAKCTNFDEIY